jgi:pyruvate/2-oxoglutarate dehydrogenase complex dihydrolipoamide acyltransferase (E2) component
LRRCHVRGGVDRTGDIVQLDENTITLETGKVALNIQSLHADHVAEPFVAEDQEIAESALILTQE